MHDDLDLFALLLATLDSAGDLMPVYLGEFAALPARQRLPPIYVWLDFDGAVHLKTDRAALSRICISASIQAGHPPLSFDAAPVTEAVAQFAALADATTAKTLLALAEPLQKLKTARARSALRWRITR